MEATAVLSDALSHAGDFAEAEAVCRETLSDVSQVKLQSTGKVPVLMSNLRLKMARAMANQGKRTQAQTMYEQCIADFTRLLGPDDSLTLESAKGLGTLLRAQGRFAEAVAMQRGHAGESQADDGFR